LDTFGAKVPAPFVVDQNPPNAPLEVAFNATLPLAQEAPPFVNEILGVVLTVREEGNAVKYVVIPLVRIGTCSR
jgi:hypothetical protein